MSAELCCRGCYLMLARVVPVSCSCAANLRSAARALWGAERQLSFPQSLGAAVPRVHRTGTAPARLDPLPHAWPHLLPVRQGCESLLFSLLPLPAPLLLPLRLVPLLPLGFLCPLLLQLLGLHLLREGPWHLEAEGSQHLPLSYGQRHKWARGALLWGPPAPRR